MKYIVLIPDGAADETYEELGGKSPLEAAKTPHLDYFAKIGKVGMAKTIPDGFEPGSDIGNLSILGYNPKHCYSGRAPLEAASMGIDLKEGEVAFRMNLVTEAQGILADYSAGHIRTQESRSLVEYLDEKLGNDHLRLHSGVSYRHIAVFKDRLGLKGLSARCTPPHNITGKKISPYWPKGPGAELLKKLMQESKKLLEDHEINHVRVDLKENPANMIWFWGQGVRPQIERFKNRFALEAGVISAVDLVRGIARLAGIDVLEVPGITGYFDTNYEGKAEYGLRSLEKKDFVLIHVEATDEAGHEGKIKMKIKAIEDFDHRLVSSVRGYFDAHEETRVLIVPDHPTSCRLKTHIRGAVPFIVAGKGITPDEAGDYSERSAGSAEFRFEEGYKLMEYFIRYQ